MLNHEENDTRLLQAFKLMWDLYPEPVRLIRKDFTVVAGNQAFLKAGGKIGDKCNATRPELHRGCQAQAALKARESKVIEHELFNHHISSYWIPVQGNTDHFIHFSNGSLQIMENLHNG